MSRYVDTVFIYGGEINESQKLNELLDSVDDQADTGRGSDKLTRINTSSVSHIIETTDGMCPEGDRSKIKLSTPIDGYVDENGRDYVKDTIELIVSIFDQTRPRYVYGICEANRDTVGMHTEEPVTDGRLTANRIKSPTWLMIFSPPMVAEYGREWLLDLPADRTEELDDGSILVVAVDDFSDCDLPLDVLDSMALAVEKLESEVVW